MTTQSMKALHFKQYGGPEVLSIINVPIPTPKEDEVLIKVKSCSLNPAELHIQSGKIWLIRLMYGLFKPNKKTQFPRADFSGTITAVGKNVTAYKIGDQIFGRNDKAGFAEYTTATLNQIALAPQNISLSESAALPLAGLTGLQAINKAQLKSNESILINGASGGIGCLTVQIAKSLNAEVTGICSLKNKTFVQNLGADQVVCYDANENAPTKTYDVVIDLVGNFTFNQVKTLLKHQGRAVIVGFTSFKNIFPFMLKGKWKDGNKGQNMAAIDAETNHEALKTIAELVESKKIKPVIEKTYAFDEIQAAFTQLGTRRTKGKLLISIS